MPLAALFDHIRSRIWDRPPGLPHPFDPSQPTGYGGPDSPRWPHEFYFRVDQMTSTLPQTPLVPVQQWLMSKPTGKWGYVFELGDLWGVGFERKEDADLYRADWEQ